MNIADYWEQKLIEVDRFLDFVPQPAGVRPNTGTGFSSFANRAHTGPG